jgi:1-deoxy-D-xylulose-5-phosphate synthase
MIVASPMNEAELRNMMYTAQLDSLSLPITIRYPRGEGVLPEWKTEMQEIRIGTGRKLKDGEGIAILSFGHPGNFVSAAIRDLKNDDIHPAHYDMRFAKPLDEALLHEVFQKFDQILTVEDGTIKGGFGSAVLEFMAEHGYQSKVAIMGIPDRLVEHGTPKELYREIGLDAESIATKVRSMMQVTVRIHG